MKPTHRDWTILETIWFGFFWAFAIIGVLYVIGVLQ